MAPNASDFPVRTDNAVPDLVAVVRLIRTSGSAIWPTWEHEASGAIFNHIKTQPYRILDVKVRPCATDRKQFEWKVYEGDGTLLASSTRMYSNEVTALRDGNATAREIRKGGQRETPPAAARRK